MFNHRSMQAYHASHHTMRQCVYLSTVDSICLWSCLTYSSDSISVTYIQCKRALIRSKDLDNVNSEPNTWLVKTLQYVLSSSLLALLAAAVY